MVAPDTARRPATTLVAGVVLGAVAIGAALAGRGTLFVLVLALALVGAGELFRIARRRGITPQPLVGFAGVVLMMFLAYADHERFDRRAPAALAGVLLAAALVALAQRRTVGATLGIAVTVLGVVWIGFLGSYILAVRGTGFRPLLVLGLMTTLNDAAAYVAGRARGRRRLAPGISPAKTWEGLVAGTLATLAVGLIAAATLDPPFTLGRALILAALVSVTAPAGDLIESAVKRDAGVKDAGAGIPGHGGALDRLDSLLLSAPVFFYAFRAMIR